jgi:type I restriction enzyme S subunit
VAGTYVEFGEAPFEIIDGDRGKNYPKQSDFLDSGHCLFLSATNVTKTGFDFAECLFIDERKDAALNKGKLQRKDIVLTTRGTVGNTAYFNHTVPFENLRINSGMVILRCDRAMISPAYLYHFLRSPSFHEQVNSLRSGVAQPQLPIRDMRRIKLPLPPLPVQHRIASILSAYDDLIQNNQRRIRILEEMARSLYREWFVNFRFPGHEKVPLVDSPLGPIPKGWEVKLVKDILSRRAAGRVYRETDVRPKGATPVFDQSTEELLGFHDNEPDHHASTTTPIAIFGDHTCKIQIFIEPFSVGPNVVPFVAIRELPTAYVFYAVNSLIQTQEYKRHWIPLNAKEIVVADHATAQHFATLIQPILIAEEIFRKAIRNLRRTRDLLLPRLFAGDVAVSIPCI